MTAPNAGGAPVMFEQQALDGGALAVTARSRVRLAPGATRDIVLVIALKSPDAGLGPIDVSLSHSGDHALAVAVALQDPPADEPRNGSA